MTLRAKLTATFATLVAALALCAGLATPAFAAGGLWTPTDGATELTELEFTKVLTLEGTTVVPTDKTFKFTMTPATVTSGTTGQNNMPVVAGVALTNSEVSIQSNDSTATTTDITNSAGTVTGKKVTYTGKFTLPTTGLSANTIYRYSVQESDAAGYTHSTTEVYTVDLYTDSDADIVAITAHHNNTKKDIVFDNGQTNTLASLRIDKDFSGDFLAGNEEVTINVTLSPTESFPSGTTINVDEWSPDGTNKYTASDTTNGKTLTVGQATSFTLKNGGYIYITGLPLTMSYTVTETQLTGYYAKYSSTMGTTSDAGTYDASTNPNGARTDSGEVAQNTNVTINHDIRAGGNTETITNYRDTSTLTGIVLNNAPYITVFAVAAIGLIAFILKRRRNATEEE